MGEDLILTVGLAILAATALAYFGHILRQPPILAYLTAGILLGPRMGLGLVEDHAAIELLSRFGLIFLLFLIGLEIDMKKLREVAGSLIGAGLLQFPLTAAFIAAALLVLNIFSLSDSYALFYISAAAGLSSTAIVIKLLYGRFELDTLAGRITLGILIFQDLWAILLLGMQPSLGEPGFLTLALSLLKIVLLSIGALSLSKYVLPRVFRAIAKVPELMLISALGWCFLVAALADILGLSIEMGALIAGISISTFPYNLDVIAKIVNIRYIFVTLFFVALGMQIPNPMDVPALLAGGLILAALLILSRFIILFPLLQLLKKDRRISLRASLNLSQMSEFSLVLASMGLGSGQIGDSVLSIILFAYVITALLSTYAINASDRIIDRLTGIFSSGTAHRRNPADQEAGGSSSEEKRDIAILGFHRVASSLLRDMIELKDRITVVDFNPEVRESLQNLGVRVVYGDISHPDTLRQAGISHARIVVSTIPDTMLVGTDNLRIIPILREICTDAAIIVNAESPARALRMYAEGADHVLLPRLLAADSLKTHILNILETSDQLKTTDSGEHRRSQRKMLKDRQEIVH